ncbi:MAG: hypothetical protein OXF49_01770 [Candidatus Saccharibacteria bacterium]|nr:hypothetical protein [Candidatus Saccharibacteria bacterium]
MYHRTISLSWLSLISLLLISFISLNSSSVSALSANLDTSQFNAGHIIDNEVFTDYETMTTEDIQAFLNETLASVGGCEHHHENIYAALPIPPYTCLAEYQQNPETGADNYGLFDENGDPTNIEGGQSSAQIIYQAAQTYKINPQVLLAVLQKEQSLLTDTWPWPRQFSKATGYGCPDHADCNSKTLGFINQINGLAWQLRHYLDNLDDWWYSLGDNTIYYHPNRNCGSTVLNLKNEATVALYLYTPYLPNQAALDNFYGEGDACSSYGNRNFWTYFNHWFGSSRTSTTEVEEETGDEFKLKTLAVYTDFTKTTEIDLETTPVDPQKQVYISVAFTNTSNQAWHQVSDQQQVSLVPYKADGYQNHICQTAPTTQSACPKSIVLKENSVAPQAEANFEFFLTIPELAASITQSFMLLEGDARYLRGQPIKLTFKVKGLTNVLEDESNISESAEIDDENDEAENTVNNSQPEAEDSQQPPEVDPTPTTETDVVLPANWANLSVIEKIRLNPYGCHDTTKIRADNGRCLSGGSTRPTNTVNNSQPEAEDSQQPPEVDPTPTTETDVVLPANWANLSVIEKIRLNPYGCHDTTKIRADNGRCLSGGSTRPTNTVNNSQPEAI